jgi:hypothetical protein
VGTLSAKNEQAMEEAKKKDAIYLGDTSDEEYSDYESTKETPEDLFA